MTDSHSPGVALALQGGGAHGGFTWGVIDKLLEDGLTPDAICGVSSGAIIGAMLAQGMVRGGHAGARAEIRKFWRTMSQAHAVSPLQNGPLERWLWGSDMSNSVLWQGLEMTMRMFSPAQLNPFGHNPLWYFLHDLVDPRLLCDPRAPRLFVSATDVETGRAVIFDNASIDADVLCASACLPFVFPAVKIGSRSYWDGGYAGNPPLGPLLRPTPPDTADPDPRAAACASGRAVTTPTEITNRLNEIACQNVLEAELAALPASVALTSYDADEALAHLPISSKFNGEEAFLTTLFNAGRDARCTVTLLNAGRDAVGR